MAQEEKNKKKQLAAVTFRGAGDYRFALLPGKSKH
jgi:hypothetical protein